MSSRPGMRKPELTVSESKARALADLTRARSALVHHAARASDELSPKAILNRSLTNHRPAWLIGASVAGLVAVRFALSFRSTKNDRDFSPKSGTKEWLFRLLRGPIFAAGQKALLNYATSQLQNHFKQQFQAQHPEESQT